MFNHSIAHLHTTVNHKKFRAPQHTLETTRPLCYNNHMNQTQQTTLNTQPGIYLLTFPGGATYVGKSVNPQQRWLQHLEKLKTGTAARNMQCAYQPGRGFQAQVLLHCHPDMLDEYEGYYINTLKPTLNTQRPAGREDYPILERWAQTSQVCEPITVALEELLEYQELEECWVGREAELLQEIESVQCELQEVQARWDCVVWRTACANALFQTQHAQLGVCRKQLQLLKVQCAAAEQQLEKIYRLNWWQRLWKAW